MRSACPPNNPLHVYSPEMEGAPMEASDPFSFRFALFSHVFFPFESVASWMDPSGFSVWVI